MALLDELTPRQRKFVLQQRVIQILNEVMVTALCTALQHSNRCPVPTTKTRVHCCSTP
jgi:hypothetical protein